MPEVMNKIIEIATTAGSKLILALLIFIIGRIVIGKLISILEKSKMTRKLDPTVRSFLMNFARVILYVIMIVAIINVLGVDTASIIAVIASCGVAVGLALQGALSNIAGGIMLLIFRPFNVGDYVAAAGEEGVVKDISLFYTTINTVDNKEITVPNGALMNANISNYSSEPLRRVDLTFNVTGAESIDKVQELILGTVAKNPLALQDPAPFASPLAGIPGGLEYTVRVWTESANYWDAYFSLLKEIATALGEAGIGGPVPASKVVMDK